MKKQLEAMATSWLRSALAGALAVYMTGNTNPKDLAMGLVAGLVPLAMRFANPKDASFGIHKA
jgi:hypothetical protein